MATEQKSGHTVETAIHHALKQKFKKKVKASGSSMAQVLRDLIQKYVKE